MSNVMLKLSASKKELYRKQRVVGRLGDGNLTTIDIYLLQEDGYSPYILTGDMILTFKGNLANGEYTEGPIIIQDSQEGFCQYTFSRENFSAAKEYKRAYIELTDASGAVTTFQDFIIDVLPNADISRGQVQLYVSKLDTLLKEFSDTYSQFVLEKENEFQNFINEKEIQYQNIYDQYNELIRRLNESDQRMNSIETDQDRIIKLIEENDVFTKTESSANVIYQVIGKEKAEITFRLDAKSEFVKVSSVGYTTLLSPTNVSWTPLTEEQLNNLSSLDGSLYSARDVAANYMKQLKYDCDILGFFKSLLGEKFFTIRGATTDSQKVEVLESLITDFTSNVYGYGSGGGINKLTHRNWNGTWTVSDSTAANEVTRIGQIIESTDTNWKKLINGGKISVLSNSEPTISPNYSTVNIDYLCLDVTIELSANEHFEYMIAAYSGENSVSLSEPQTVEGLKNFSDGVQSKGIDVATQDMTKVTLFQSTEISNVKGTASGIVWPIDETAIVFGGVGAHARRGGTSEPGTIYFNEAGQYLIELLWFVNSGTATRKYVYMDWIKHGTTDLLFRSGIGENNGFSYTSSVPGGGIITMGKDEGVDILLKTNVEDLIAGVKIYYIKISKIG